MEETLNNAKEVKQSTLSKNFYLIVYNYLKSGKTIQDVLFDYSISKQKLQYYINRLKNNQPMMVCVNPMFSEKKLGVTVSCFGFKYLNYTTGINEVPI